MNKALQWLWNLCIEHIPVLTFWYACYGQLINALADRSSGAG